MAKLGRGARLHLVARTGHTGLSSREPMCSVARLHAKPQPGYRSIPSSIERLKPRSRPRGLAYRSSECVCRGAPTLVIGCAVANSRRSALANAADSGRQRVLCGGHRDVVGGHRQLTCVLAATASHDMRCVCWFLSALVDETRCCRKADPACAAVIGFPVGSAMSSVLISECGGFIVCLAIARPAGLKTCCFAGSNVSSPVQPRGDARGRVTVEGAVQVLGDVADMRGRQYIRQGAQWVPGGQGFDVEHV